MYQKRENLATSTYCKHQVIAFKTVCLPLEYTKHIFLLCKGKCEKPLPAIISDRQVKQGDLLGINKELWLGINYCTSHCT